MKSLVASLLVVFSFACGPDWIVPKGPEALVRFPTPPFVPDSGHPVGSDAAPPHGGPGPQEDGGQAVADAGTDGGATACDPTTINSTGTPPLGCFRVDGTNVGLLATYPVGSGTVTITGWTYKDDSATQTDGFSYTSTVAVGYAVKSGTETDYGTTSPWANPNGTAGPTVYGISNVTVCVCEGN